MSHETSVPVFEVLGCTPEEAPPGEVWFRYDGEESFANDVIAIVFEWFTWNPQTRYLWKDRLI